MSNEADNPKHRAIAKIRASEAKQCPFEGVESGGAAKRILQPHAHILRAILHPLSARVLGADGEPTF